MTREECYEIIEQFRKKYEHEPSGMYYVYGACAAILSTIITAKDKEMESTIGMEFFLSILQNKDNE